MILFFLTRRICRDLQAADRAREIQEEAEEEGREHERQLLRT
jgi:hypothetical protein